MRYSNRFCRFAWLLGLGALILSCGAGGGADDETTFTAAEITLALEESVKSAEGEAAVSEIIEINTNFTIGDAVDEAREELRAWLESQIACSTVTLEGSTITLDFGDLDDDCVYNGHTYAGTDAITLERNDTTDVLVSHVFTNLTNGDVTVNGTASVTWSASALSRRVVHNLQWTGPLDTAQLSASGDRTQQLLIPGEGIDGGLQVDGERDWTTSNGTWHLAINTVQMRGVDPVPYSGSYALTNPSGDVLSIAFSYVDEDTIQVTVTGGRRDWVFNVNSTGSSIEETSS